MVQFAYNSAIVNAIKLHSSRSGWGGSRVAPVLGGVPVFLAALFFVSAIYGVSRHSAVPRAHLFLRHLGHWIVATAPGLVAWQSILDTSIVRSVIGGACRSHGSRIYHINPTNWPIRWLIQLAVIQNNLLDTKTKGTTKPRRRDPSTCSERFYT